MISSKQISDVLLKVYDFSPHESFTNHLFEVFNEYIPSTISSFGLTDLEAGRFKLAEVQHHRGGAVPPLAELNALVQDHPFIEYFVENSTGPVLSILDILSDDEWKRNSIYTELYRPLGVVHDTSIRFYFGSTCMSFHFADVEPLGMDERRMLTLISPHLGKAYRIYKYQQHGLMGKVPDNIVMLDETGHAVDCSDRSRDLFSNYFPKALRGSEDGLPASVEQWIKQVSDAGTSEKRAGISRKLFSRRGEQSLVLSLHHGDRCKLLVLEESRIVRIIDVLIDFGLTAREAEVMTWVAQGKQNSEVATILGIQLATVRKHMEHVLQKLRCETRGAAAQLVMNAISDELPHAQCRTCTHTECIDCSV